MSPIFYALNIGTLATWISVAGFGTVGIVVPMAGEMLHMADPAADPYRDLESTVLVDDFTPPDPVDEAPAAAGMQPENVAAEPEVLPAPPEMPELSESEPLPEVPTLAPRPEPDFTTPAPAKPQPKPQVKSTAPPTRAAAAPAKPQGPVTGPAAGSGLSDSQRLSSGRMPPPAYPAEARAKSQTGTVVVEFVVGADGKVASVYTKNPSPWPLLNERAVSTVRRWTFPPGRVSKYVRPITFKLK